MKATSPDGRAVVAVETNGSQLRAEAPPLQATWALRITQ